MISNTHGIEARINKNISVKIPPKIYGDLLI